jgi:integrase
MPKLQPKFFSVKKAPNPNGRCQYYISGFPKGKRELYWFRTEKEAKQAKEDKNTVLAANGNAAALDASTRLMAIECLKMLEPFGKNLFDATRYYVEHLKLVNTSVQVKILTEAVRNEFHRRVLANEVSAGHEETMRHALNVLDRAFGESPAKTITGDEMKGWLQTTEWSVKTRNNMMGYWKNAFSVGKDLKLVNENPLIGVKGFTNTKASEVRVLTVDEATKLINAMPDAALPFFAIGAFGGIRRSEREQLDWSMINLDKKQIRVPREITKLREDRLVRLQDNVVEWLRPHAKVSGSILPASLTDGKPSVGRLEELLNDAQKASGVSMPRNALRHSFCSYHYALLENPDLTAEYAGHDVKMLKKNYRHTVEPEEAVKYFAIKPGAK